MKYRIGFKLVSVMMNLNVFRSVLNSSGEAGHQPRQAVKIRSSIESDEIYPSRLSIYVWVKSFINETVPSDSLDL